MLSEMPNGEKFPKFLSEEYISKLEKIDQECRQQGFPAGAEFIDKIAIANNITSEGELMIYFKSKKNLDNEDKMALQVILFGKKWDKNDKFCQSELKKILLVLDKLPNESDNVHLIHTMWLIAQHSNKNQELQVEMLGRLVESQNNVSLDYCYYLCDRLTMAKFNYQYFGTQLDGQNMVALEDAEFEIFRQKPYETCLDLSINKRSDNLERDRLKFQKSWNIAKINKKSRFTEKELYPDIVRIDPLPLN